MIKDIKDLCAIPTGLPQLFPEAALHWEWCINTKGEDFEAGKAH